MPSWYRQLLAGVVLGLAAFTNGALADRGNYWGLAAQLHSQDVYVEENTLPGTRIDTDTSSFGTRLFVGRYLHRHIAVESGAMVYRTPRATLHSDSDESVGDFPSQDEMAVDLRLLASIPLGNDVVVQGYVGQRFWNQYRYFPQAGTAPYSQSTEIDTTGGMALGIGWGRNALVLLGVDYMDSQPNESVSASLGIAFRFR